MQLADAQRAALHELRRRGDILLGVGHAHAAPAAQAGANAVPSPLPGNINAVNFSVGQSVKAGDVVIILEAMKMENEIVSPKAGTITKLYVQKGAVVNTGDPLFDVE